MGVVLIVEDELLEQDFLKSIVAEELSENDRVITCESGNEAISKAKEHRPDIIIMDLIIPERDGLSAIEEIRKFLPDARIMILSAHSEFSYAQRALSLDVSEYLLKPIKPAKFRETFLKLRQQYDKKAKGEKEQPVVPDVEQRYFVEKAVKYITENYKEKLTLQMVASHIFMNPQYFSRIFKKEMGCTYTEFVNHLKIVCACKLLETTNYPAYRISGECGFADPSYFNRVFFKQMKMTPLTYKKRVSMSRHQHE